MKRASTIKIVITAMFASLVCVATMLVQLPIPATGGYANLGDGVILISACLIAPVCSALAAGVGSLLADLLAGYAAFAPGTLAIKGCVALIAALIYRRLDSGRFSNRPRLAMLTAGIPAEAFMVLGYFAYEALCLGEGMGALSGVIGNVCQGAVGVIVTCAAAPVLTRSDEINELMRKTWR